MAIVAEIPYSSNGTQSAAVKAEPVRTVTAAAAAEAEAAADLTMTTTAPAEPVLPVKATQAHP